MNRGSEDLLLNIEGDTSIVRHEIKKLGDTMKFRLTVVREPENTIIKADHEMIDGYG